MPWTRGGSEHALGEIPWRDFSGSPSAVVGGSFVPEIRDGYTELISSNLANSNGLRKSGLSSIHRCLASSFPRLEPDLVESIAGSLDDQG
ncbi:hypothetical protein CSOJ01_06239 [Colletotrichum sojae]|uniref:Uncharacterized protein n=1 Tax=Colletotrichum sojae TaxID=2175907 RepID=A0A8H6MW88_9PEZI|nr:hypothetical protein CSOJ01_06239 [Colletotrichum sojae]